jgi:hypothetical protein
MTVLCPHLFPLWMITYYFAHFWIFDWPTYLRWCPSGRERRAVTFMNVRKSGHVKRARPLWIEWPDAPSLDP